MPPAAPRPGPWCRWSSASSRVRSALTVASSCLTSAGRARPRRLHVRPRRLVAAPGADRASPEIVACRAEISPAWLASAPRHRGLGLALLQLQPFAHRANRRLEMLVRRPDRRDIRRIMRPGGALLLHLAARHCPQPAPSAISPGSFVPFSATPGKTTSRLRPSIDGISFAGVVVDSRRSALRSSFLPSETALAARRMPPATAAEWR